jgi:hypothetical protein
MTTNIIYYKDHNIGHYLVAIQDYETKEWDWYEMNDTPSHPTYGVNLYLETIEKEEPRVIGRLQKEEVPEAVREATRQRTC